MRPRKARAPSLVRRIGRPCKEPEASSAEIRPANDPYKPIFDAPPDRPFVVAQLGQSLDGRIAAASGESRYINGPGALDHLHRLRALCDAVVVGAGAVIADDPLLTVRRVEGRNPARVVIDPSYRVPSAARCLAPDGTRRIVVTAAKAEAPPGVELLNIPLTNATMSCKAIVSELFNRGLRRVLIEGGAATVSAFISEDAVDRLHVLVAPLILGSGKIGIELPNILSLGEARRPEVQIYCLGEGDVLFDCDMRSRKA